MSNKHSIDDLRARLFEVIDGVKSGVVSIEQAKVIGEISQVVVNSAKVEVDYLRGTQRESRFIERAEAVDELDEDSPGITATVRHLIRR